MPTDLPSRRTTLAFSALIGLFLWGRGLWEGPGPAGVFVEVQGDLPRSGVFLLESPTLLAAIRASGGDDGGVADQQLREGQRVVWADGGWTVRDPAFPPLFGQALDVNTADAAAFASIPGIGPSVARRIVEDREFRGDFRSGGGVGRVRGVGGRVLGKLAPYVSEPALVAEESREVARQPVPLTSKEVPPKAERAIDINRASAQELERLPGVGPAIAKRMVAWRAQFGPFRSLQDLTRVKGIGPKTVERIKAHAKISQENG